MKITNKSGWKSIVGQKVPLDIEIMDQESGAMAMSMIFKYFNLYLNREAANHEAGISTKGTTINRLNEAFFRNGFDSVIRSDINDDFDNFLVPSLAGLNDGKYCVITKLTRDKIFINDPEKGRVKMSKKKFSSLFSGELIEAFPNEKFNPKGSNTGLMDVMKSWLGNSRRIVIYALILGLVLIIPKIILPVSYKVFLDNILDLRQNYLFRPLILTLSVLMVYTAVVTYVQWRLITRLEIKMALINSANFFRHLLRLPLPFFLGRYPGELGKRIPLNANLAMVFAVDLPKTIINIFSIILFAIVMLNYNVVLTLVGVAFSVLNLWALKIISNKREALNQTIVQNQGKVYSESMVGLKMIETIKASGLESDFFAHWAGYQTRFVNNYQKLGYINRFLDVLPKLLNNLNNIILICMGALLVIYGSMTVGFLVAFQSLMDSFTKPVSEILNTGSKFQDASSAITTLSDATDVKQEEIFIKYNSGNPAVTPANAKIRGELVIKNIKFGYDRFDSPLIEDFSLTLKPGSCVALVGSSGSGKSTLAKIIIGIHKQWSGEILFDGKPYEEYPPEIFSGSVSMVDQNIFLFSGTVNENLTMWNDSTPKENIIAASEDACIHEVITERPGGYAAKVEEGGKNFSGGQQQRLEIARALVTNPSILILDEATSALDPNTEKMVIDNLRHRATTTLVIAHRLSTIKNCDKIVVLDKGQIVQEGTHDELMQQQDKMYYKLIKTS